MQLASFLYVFVLLNDHQDFLCFSTSRRRLLSAQSLWIGCGIPERNVAYESDAKSELVSAQVTRRDSGRPGPMLATLNTYQSTDLKDTEYVQHAKMAL